VFALVRALGWRRFGGGSRIRFLTVAPAASPNHAQCKGKDNSGDSPTGPVVVAIRSGGYVVSHLAVLLVMK
jgi:hypothetical protein